MSAPALQPELQLDTLFIGVAVAGKTIWVSIPFEDLSCSSAAEVFEHDAETIFRRRLMSAWSALRDQFKDAPEIAP